jgi:hypothetical protein
VVDAARRDRHHDLCGAHPSLGHGLLGHILGGLGIIKAWRLRIKVWVALVTGIGLAGGGAH